MRLVDLEADRQSTWCYDIEVYPNLFSITFIHAYEETENVFVVFGNRDDRKALFEFMSEENLVLVGYNSLGYDNIILNAVLENPGMPQSILLKLLYSLSQGIVGTPRNQPLPEAVKKYKWLQTRYKRLDLMTIRPGAISVSLKQIAINLKWHRVQDLPIPFNENIQDSQLEKLLDYNRNDVQITKQLFHYLLEQGEIQLRLDASKLYDVDVTNRDRSGIANVLMNKFYAEYTGIPYKEFREMRTDRSEIYLSECIPDNVTFSQPILKSLVKELKGTVLKKSWNSFKKKYSFSFKKVLRLAGITFDMGVGGLHSRDEPGLFQTTDKSFLVDCDVTSFYPFLMLNLNIKPEHCSDDFYSIMKMLVEERVKAKKTGNEVSSNVLKIVINSLFGKLGSEHSWLKDDLALLRVTIAGQLYLLSLIDRFISNGIKVISANTDGIVCEVKESQKDLYNAICKEWEESTNLSLEFTNYNQFYRRDVNNYITVTNKGKKKVKGCFLSDIDLYKGFKHPIVATALQKYFLEGIEPSETIRNCQSIYEFCISQKVAADFKTKFFSMTSEGFSEVSLQKNNRYYISTVGGSIYKTKKDSDRKLSLIAGEVVEIANDIDETRPISSYPIKYEWYINEAWKIIDLIKPRILQTSLF